MSKPETKVETKPESKPQAAPQASPAAAAPPLASQSKRTTRRTTFFIKAACFREGRLYSPGETITIEAGQPISAAFGEEVHAREERSAVARPDEDETKPANRPSDRDL